MRKSLFFLLLFMSCSTFRGIYNPQKVYVIARTNDYDMYIDRDDMINSLNHNHVYPNGENVQYDFMYSCNQTVSFRLNHDNTTFFLLDMADWDKDSIVSLFEFTVRDLFKKNKVLVYDKKEKTWIKYKVKYYKFLIAGEEISYYRVHDKRNGHEIYYYE